MRSIQLFAVLMIALWASFATASPVITNMHVPLTGTVSLVNTNELVEVTGKVHVLTRCIPPDECIVHVKSVGVEAVGPSGQRYRSKFAASVDLGFFPGTLQGFGFIVPLRPVGSSGLPGSPKPPNDEMVVGLTMTFDTTGELVSLSAEAFTSIEGGG